MLSLSRRYVVDMRAHFNLQSLPFFVVCREMWTRSRERATVSSRGWLLGWRRLTVLIYFIVDNHRCVCGFIVVVHTSNEERISRYCRSSLCRRWRWCCALLGFAQSPSMLCLKELIIHDEKLLVFASIIFRQELRRRSVIEFIWKVLSLHRIWSWLCPTAPPSLSLFACNLLSFSFLIK